jgi:hypothetical protein
LELKELTARGGWFVIGYQLPSSTLVAVDTTRR